MTNEQNQPDQGEFHGWPTGDLKIVLLLDMSLAEASKEYGLSFNRLQDDHDWFDGAHLLDEKLGPVVFAYYENRPIKGMEIWVDAGLDGSSTADYLIGRLKIDEDLIKSRCT